MTSELEWVAAVSGQPVHRFDDLRDGTVLCQLANKIRPGSAKFKQSPLPFVHRENIVAFLQAASAIGVPDHELFETEDLFDERDERMVLTCLRALSRVAHKFNSSIPIIGPPLSTKHVPPKPTAPKFVGWNEAQYGTLHGANQSNQKVYMGMRQDIVSKVHDSTEIDTSRLSLPMRDPSIPLNIPSRSRSVSPSVSPAPASPVSPGSDKKRPPKPKLNK